MKKILPLFVFVLFASVSNGQILISLLLGDKLNNGKIEFGLDGGLNLTSLAGLTESKDKKAFNLGFYFDFKLKNNWRLNTGVLVKSTMGATGIPTYLINNPDLDHAFEGGEVIRTLPYFNVPVQMKYIFKNNIFALAGIQLGLLYKPYDLFTQNVQESDDLTYKLSTKGSYNSIDAGLSAGIGYRLLKGNGINLTLRYYLGLLDIQKTDNGTNIYNRSFYVSAGIPVGVKKAKSANNASGQ